MVSKLKVHVHKILSHLRKLINLPINKVQRLSSFFFLYWCWCLFCFDFWVCLAEFPLQVCLFIDFSVRSTAQVLNIKTLICVNSRLSLIIQSLVRWTSSKTEDFYFFIFINYIYKDISFHKMLVSSVFYYYCNNLGYNYRIKLLSDVQIQSLTFTYLLWTSHAEQCYRVSEVVARARFSPGNTQQLNLRTQSGWDLFLWSKRCFVRSDLQFLKGSSAPSSSSALSTSWRTAPERSGWKEEGWSVEYLLQKNDHS